MCALKHQDEWEDLIHLGYKHGLTEDQIYFLLALREVEDGRKGNEFNIKDVKNTSFVEQTVWAIGSIKANEKRWQDYIINQEYIDYIDFFCYFGGPLKTGWHIVDKGCLSTEFWISIMKSNIKECKHGFERNKEMGREDRYPRSKTSEA